MSERRIIVHKVITIAAMVFSVVTLPFSIKACHTAIIVLLISWCFEGQWRCKLNIIRQSLLLQLMVCFFVFQIVGLSFSDNLQGGWFSLEKKIFFLLLPVALATTAVKLNEKEIKWIVASFIFACFSGTLLCLAQAWGQTEMFAAGRGHINPYLATSSYFELNGNESKTWLFFSYVSLSEGIGIHPTYLSLFLVFCIIFLLHKLPALKPGLIHMGVILLVLYFTIIIVLLSSRIVTFGLSIIFIAVATRCLINKQRHLGLVVILLSLSFSFLIFANPVSRYRSLQEFNTSTFRIEPGHEYQNSAQIRISLWWLAVKSIDNSNPFFGAGTGDVEKMMAETSKQYDITNVLHSHDPHNQFLYSLLGNGYPGLLLLILCVAAPAYFAWAMKDFLLLGFSFMFCLLCFTESALELQKGIVFYSLFFPLLYFQLNSFQRIAVVLRSIPRAGN